jgi:uncharacterized protein (DUF1778 family)
LDHRIRIQLAKKDHDIVARAAEFRGIGMDTFARSAVLEAAREIERRVLTDWQLQQSIVLNLLENGFNTIESLNLACGLPRAVIKAQLAVLESAGQIEERRQPCNHQVNANKRGTVLYFLVGKDGG